MFLYTFIFVSIFTVHVLLYVSVFVYVPVPVLFRCLRTEMVHCSSDVEYLCKLHCIRLAFQWVFRDSDTWVWFADAGRQVLTDLLLYADKVCFSLLLMHYCFL